jgi:excisionase family DNA binding protein
MSERKTLFGDLSGIDFSKAEVIDVIIPDTEDTQLSLNVPSPVVDPPQPPPAPIKYPEKTEKIFSPPIKDQIMTVFEASQYLQVRQETILRKIYAKELRASKVGRIWRIRLSDINSYLERNAEGFLEE